MPRALFVTACLLTLLAIFYAEENWRGRRTWNNCRKQLEAKGVNLNWAARIPSPVPDEENIFKAPGIADWFIKSEPKTKGTTKLVAVVAQDLSSNELSRKYSGVGECIGRQNSNAVAEVTIVGLNTETLTASADIIITNSQSLRVGPAQTDKLRHVVYDSLSPAAAASNAPSLKGAQDYTLQARPSDLPVATVRITVCTDKVLSPKEIADLFPGGGGLRVEPKGPNQFDVFLRNPKVCWAADYLACTDALAPEFDQMRSALKRPYARREGDYEHTWAVPIQNFITIRMVAQVLSQRAQCDLLLGKPEAAVRELTLLHDLSRLLDSKPMTLVGAMINVAVCGLYTSIIGDGLRLHAWREPQLVVLQKQLEEIQLLPQLVEAMDTERVSACHLFETTRVADLETIFVFGRDKPSFWAKIQEPTFWALRCMPRGWFFQNMAALARREQAFLETIDPTKNTIKAHVADEIGGEAIAWVTHPSPYTVLARVAMPNFLKATQTVAQKQTIANQALLACALERYHLARNEYPERLAAVSPEFVARVPTDVITGESMWYRRVDPQHFLLYSVGWNQTDDDGKAGKSLTEGDWVWEAQR
ncbi:MAG TPA: hypothetical protein VL361_17955 [Candidatus Limnocylindrales bacterium]|nr:hypothetical protein [Candidatus Limnocylindrales bacterium]